MTPGIASDRLLNGPTNLVWIQPWLDYLRDNGVEYHFGAEVVAINAAAGRIESATVRVDGQERQVAGDYFIGALPVERIAPLVTPDMTAIDPKLANLKPLANNVQWMNGIQYYLSKDVPITHGHIIFIDSPWALTAVSQKQFWEGIDFRNWGEGKTRGLLSVDISQWDRPGFNGKRAIDCSREEIADEVWLQLKRSLNVDGDILLRDEDMHSWFLDPDIRKSATDRSKMEDVEPLLVNRVNTWRLRPEAGTGIPNFMLASDYVRTYTDLATMEGANEAARRAVNVILERSNSSAERCPVWNLHEPDAFAPLRAYDRARYQAGLPWDGRFAKAMEATLDMGQQTIGMTHGGDGPLAVFAPLTDELSKPTAPPDPALLQALSFIGIPAHLAEGICSQIPGLTQPVPGQEFADQAGETVGAETASASVSRNGAPERLRIRVTQKA